MLEQQRIEYLQAMGIQLWMPRQALDNAAEPNWLADAGLSNKTAESVQGGESIQAGHAADLLVDIGFVESKPAPQAIAKAPLSDDAVSKGISESSTLLEASSLALGEAKLDGDLPIVVDLTVPNFELYFALWPCGILWVASKSFERLDHTFQASVNYSLFGNSVPQANYSEFKWPYIEGSHEDQSMAVALRALTAQWEFMSGQGARGWVAMDDSSLEWLLKVAAKPVFSISDSTELYCATGKKQLWRVLQSLYTTTD